MSDLLKVARKLSARGVSRKDALAKFERALVRANAPKRRRSAKTIRIYEDGIKRWLDERGNVIREKCMTSAAEQKRREECCKAADDLCQRCGVEVGLSEGQVHHKRKRSLGQDDRLSNLEWLCGNCHARHHHEGAGQ